MPMYLYRVERPGHPDHGAVRAHPRDLTGRIGPTAEGDYRYYLPLGVVDADDPEARHAAAFLRERARRLVDSDWTQLGDAPVSRSQRKAWAAYRQALRDLPTCWKGEWPVPPA
jgi:hypothetical protein